jgi:hypothetical protein
MDERNPLKKSLAAARSNLKPGFVLQAFALAIVLSYYFIPAFHEAVGQVAKLKRESGLIFSALSTCLFGGLIPFFILKFSKATKDSTPWIFLPFYALFWMYKGVEVDLFYRLQALLFGSGNSVGTIVAKVAVDQFVYNPVWACPTQILGFMWLNAHYDFGVFKKIDGKDFWANQVFTALVSTWCLWVPMTAIIYSLPSDLQIPLFNIVLCFWVLILTFITNKPSARRA